jgi:TolB-like protein/DNA-binding winged helix-turn-helix (wHTH) protein
VIYRFADFRLDATHRLLLSTDGQVLPIASRAFDALLLFVQHPGELLDKSTLMKTIWPNSVVEENNLNQHISALRKLLGETPDSHRFIVTIPGRGYRFVAPVTTETEHGAASAAAEAAVALGMPAPLPAPAVAVHDPLLPARRGPVLVASVTIAVLIAAALFWVWRHAGRQVAAPPAPATTSSKAPAAPGVLRLAILPLENLSPNPQDAFFADGLHEELLTTVAERLAGVEVISRTTMMSYRQNPKPLAVVAQELGATDVIEGSVRREGQHVRLTVQLIDARTDGHLWAKSYDRTLSSALTLESEVAQEIASQLSVQLRTASTARGGPPTQDSAAYDLYLKAVLALREIGADEPLQAYNAIADLLTQAIRRDPDFALAYAQRARLGTLMFVGNIVNSDEQLAHIRDDLANANRLAPDEPLVLAVNAFFQMGQNENERALETIARAEAAGITDPMLLLPKARLLLRMSRGDEVMRTHDRMLALDPSNPVVLFLAADGDSVLRRPETALRMADLSEKIDSHFGQAVRTLILFGYSGDTAGWRASYDFFASKGGGCEVPNPYAVRASFDLLRYEHRYRELDACLQKVTFDSMRTVSTWSTLFDSVGDMPVAEYRGWTAMLLGDRGRAQHEGRNVLQFLAHRKVTPFNRIYLGLLEAEGQMFLGERAKAISAARASLELAPRARDAIMATAAGSIGARVYAWSGAYEQADALLEELATATPGMPPAEITRDPLYSIPLKDDARFQALSVRLEGQMRALNLH